MLSFPEDLHSAHSQSSIAIHNVGELLSISTHRKTPFAKNIHSKQTTTTCTFNLQSSYTLFFFSYILSLFLQRGNRINLIRISKSQTRNNEKWWIRWKKFHSKYRSWTWVKGVHFHSKLISIIYCSYNVGLTEQKKRTCFTYHLNN